jgi:hypothetical protein
MADVPGKFMMCSGSRPFRARPVLSYNSLLTGSIHEIDSSITQFQHDLSIFPRSDPRRLPFVCRIAFRQVYRYQLSNQREDLDKAIVNFTESILLSPLSRPQHGPKIIQALFVLARALFLRSNVSKQPDDAIYATKYLSHLRDQPHEIRTMPRYRVTALLVDTLASQVKLEAGNVMQNIRKMVVLSREVLETSDIDATHFIVLIHAVVIPRIGPGVPDQPLDELIEFSRVARKRRPDLLEGHITFAYSLVCRYVMTCENYDYEEAVSILDEIIAYRSPENSQDEYFRAQATGIVSQLAQIRSNTYDNPEYLEEAIYRARTCASSSSFKEHFPGSVRDPEAIGMERFHHFGSVEGVEESFGNSLDDEEDIQTIGRMKDLLFGIQYTDDMAEIDVAIEKGRSILASSPDVTVPILISFEDVLDEAFYRTKKIEYLNESISVHRQLVEPPFGQAVRFWALPLLSQSLLARSRYFPDYRTQDLDEGIELLSQYASSTHASVPDRFHQACRWAFHAQRTRHSSVSSAYETALSLMQDTVLFSPTLQLQHDTLATDEDAIGTRTLSMDYASYRVDQDQLEEAIEVLEGGRALLWSEMRHLRMSIDHLLSADPVLGHKFTAVNRDLEQLTKSVPPSHKLSMDDGAADGLRAVDQFGRLLLEQRDLLKERAELISQIQALPGLNSFLTSPPFDTLRSAASSGPVIIINHSLWRSDILVLLHNKPPSLITTPDDFFKRAGALKDKLLDSRPKKPEHDWRHYNDVLASVLAELYILVGQPVIDRLRQLQVPEQSRIWWCPTSVFCSLPLHAMGPIPSDDGEPRYFLDLYICSYTPTLSALIQSRRRDSNLRSWDRPSILLVAQPDPSLPTVGGEIQAVQALDIEVKSLISEAATPATVIDGFHHHRFVHFACHGSLEAGKPFEAGFELHGDARLKLIEIVRAHLPTAEFAFLSACHTAEVTEGSVIDEGLHLAAAVQYCGFRSVVGTMWAMADTDGRDLAKYFYKALFSGSRGMSYHEESAKALRSAVKKLRRKRGSPWRGG